MVISFRDSRGREKSLFDTRSFPQRLKSRLDFAARTARLKPRPFKTRSKSQFFRKLSSRSLVTAALVSM